VTALAVLIAIAGLAVLAVGLTDQAWPPAVIAITGSSSSGNDSSAPTNAARARWASAIDSLMTSPSRARAMIHLAPDVRLAGFLTDLVYATKDLGPAGMTSFSLPDWARRQVATAIPESA
jgi:hypothetical protein